jgi:hypothetical protein
VSAFTTELKGDRGHRMLGAGDARSLIDGLERLLEKR